MKYFYALLIMAFALTACDDAKKDNNETANNGNKPITEAVDTSKKKSNEPTITPALELEEDKNLDRSKIKSMLVANKWYVDYIETMKYSPQNVRDNFAKMGREALIKMGKAVTMDFKTDGSVISANKTTSNNGTWTLSDDNTILTITEPKKKSTVKYYIKSMTSKRLAMEAMLNGPRRPVILAAVE